MSDDTVKKKTRGVRGEGSIYKSKAEDKWIAQLRVNGKPVKKRFDKRLEANQWLKEEKERLKIGKSKTTQEELTIEEYISRFLKSKQSVIRARSYDRLESTVRVQVIPRVGHLILNELETTFIQDIFSDMKDDGKSRSSILKVKEALNGMYNYANYTERLAIYNCSRSA